MSRATALGAALLVAAGGCGGDNTARELAKLNTNNAQRLANLYAAHQNGKGGKGPKDEAEFKAFISSYAPDKLSMMGVDASNLDGLFKSDRDSQPFKLRYGVGGGRGSADPVVFETAGQEGKKQVAFTGGKLEEVDDARYKELLAGKPATPTAPAAGERAAGGPGRPGMPAYGPPGGKP